MPVTAELIRPKHKNNTKLRIFVTDTQIQYPICSIKSKIPPMSAWDKNIDGYISKLKQTYDDDGIDRLNYVYTIYLLLGFALTIFGKNYVGEPLQCWVPKQWTDVWESYSEMYCFVENTYFVPMNDTNLPQVQTREGREMIYYQWVPFILSLMAFLFYLPRGVWHIFSSYSGLALSDMMSAARASAKKMKENTKKLNHLAMTMEQKVRNPEPKSYVKYGSSLFNTYIMMKVLIWLNLIAQFFFLNHFLGTNYLLWGFGILRDILNGRQWQQSGHFPRVAFCDLTVREMGNVNNWTVQCVLMVNMFNEKIFLFLWWWLAAVLLVTTFNLIHWVINRFGGRTISFLKEIMKVTDFDATDRELQKFYQDVLKEDGVLVLRLLDKNGGRIQSSELFSQLWKMHYSITSEPGTPQLASSPQYDEDDEKAALLRKDAAEHSGKSTFL